MLSSWFRWLRASGSLDSPILTVELAIDGAAIGAAPHALNPEMIISAQATSQARRPLLAGRTAPRSPPAHFTSLLAARAVRTLGLSHRG